MTDKNSEPTKKPIDDEKIDSSNNFYKIQRISIDSEPALYPSEATPSDIFLYENYVKRIQSRGDSFLSNLILLAVFCFCSYVILDSLLFICDDIIPVEVVNNISYFGRARVIYCNIWGRDFSSIFYNFLFLRAFTLTILIPLIPGVVFYYLNPIRNIQRAEEKLLLIKEGYENSILEKLDSPRNFFRRQLRELTADSARISFNEERKEKVSYLRKQAGKLLEEAGKISDINEVEYLLNSIRELIQSEQREQKAQERWRIINVIVILIYIASLVFIMFYAAQSNPQLQNAKIPFLDVPLWAIIWGATGSISAVLYRFYTIRQIQFFQESQWLFARPLIGILMSAVAYSISI